MSNEKECAEKFQGSFGFAATMVNSMSVEDAFCALSSDSSPFSVIINRGRPSTSDRSVCITQTAPPSCNIQHTRKRIRLKLSSIRKSAEMKLKTYFETFVVFSGIPVVVRRHFNNRLQVSLATRSATSATQRRKTLSYTSKQSKSEASVVTGCSSFSADNSSCLKVKQSINKLTAAKASEQSKSAVP